MSNSVKPRSIATARKSIDRRLEESDRRFEGLTRRLAGIESRLGNLMKTTREVVDALNSASVLLSCVERFLDERFGEDWDAGVRKEALRRGELVRRRKEIMLRVQTEAKTLKIEDRNALAREIWAIARDLDVRAADAPAVVSLHLQNGDVESALDVVEEIRGDGVAVQGEVDALISKLVSRCVEVADERGNDVLAQRARNLATAPAG